MKKKQGRGTILQRDKIFADDLYSDNVQVITLLTRIYFLNHFFELTLIYKLAFILSFVWGFYFLWFHFYIEVLVLAVNFVSF